MAQAAGAARVGDPFGHSSAMNGVVAGLVIGALIGVAIVATGGMGAIAIGAAIATTGGAGLAGQAIGQTIDGPMTGFLMVGSPTVLIEHRDATMAVLATGICDKDSGPPRRVATGSASVRINGQPAARVGETMDCSAVIRKGSSTVFIGEPSQPVLAIQPEVPQWLNTTMTAMAIGGSLVATAGIAVSFGIGAAAGSLVGGTVGGWAGGEGGSRIAAQLGYGETGQVVGGALGGLVGGAVGGGLGFKGGQMRDIAANRATASKFYEDQGFKPADIPDHVSGIDLTRPVGVHTLKAGTPVSQYQVPGGRQGNYYAPSGTQPTELGIAPQGVSRTTGAVVDKVPTAYTTTRDIPVLRSTAAPVKDTWSIPGTAVQTKGGGTQYFTTDKGGFTP